MTAKLKNLGGDADEGGRFPDLPFLLYGHYDYNAWRTINFGVALPHCEWDNNQHPTFGIGSQSGGMTFLMRAEHSQPPLPPL